MIFDCPVYRKKSRIPYLMVHANGNSCRIPFYKNLDPREKTWICAYGPIEQPMEYGDGNLLAKNVCVRIPMEQGEWVITMGEQ